MTALGGLEYISKEVCHDGEVGRGELGRPEVRRDRSMGDEPGRDGAS